MGIPAYMQSSPLWDLSLLVDQATVEAHPGRRYLEPTLAAATMTPAGFPLAVIESLSTLDGAQAAAVKVRGQYRLLSPHQMWYLVTQFRSE